MKLTSPCLPPHIRLLLTLLLLMVPTLLAASCSGGGPPSSSEARILMEELPAALRGDVESRLATASFEGPEEELRWLRGVARAALHCPMEVCLGCSAGSQDALGPRWIELGEEGRVVPACSDSCLLSLGEDPASTLARIDAAVIEAQLPTYPTSTCPIGESPIDSMGGPLDVVIEGRLVRFCCEGCIKPFQREAEHYFTWLDDQSTANDR